jgi:hypothetical protein
MHVYLHSNAQQSSHAEQREMRQVLSRCRIIAVMARGSPAVLPEAWRSYLNVDEARTAAAAALRDARVLGVAIVEDGNHSGS